MFIETKEAKQSEIKEQVILQMGMEFDVSLQILALMNLLLLFIVYRIDSNDYN